MTQSASASGMDAIALDFHGNNQLAGYNRTFQGNRLTLSRDDGSLVQVTAIEQSRDRTGALITSAAQSLPDSTPHYRTVNFKLDPSGDVQQGDVWQIQLNGQEPFSVTADANDNLAGVAEKLASKISTESGDVYSASLDPGDRNTLVITPGANAWFSGMTAEGSEGSGKVQALFDIDEATIRTGYDDLGFWFFAQRFQYTDSLFLEIFDAATGQPIVPSSSQTGDTKNTGVAANASVDKGSVSRLDPFVEHEFDRAGEYIVRVGSYRDYAQIQPFFSDTYTGVRPGMSYELNVSLQRHATNPDAIELVGKQVSIVDGDGQGQSGTIVAYDAESMTYTVDQKWDNDVSLNSKFEIEYHLQDEFSGYQEVGDSYLMVLTTRPVQGSTVVIDVQPEITRTYNSDLAFVAEANYGERRCQAGGRRDATGRHRVGRNSGRGAVLDVGDQRKSVSLPGQGWRSDRAGRRRTRILASRSPSCPTVKRSSSGANGETLTITSSLYLDQIAGQPISKLPTSFTSELSIRQPSGIPGTPGEVEPAGAAMISDRDAVSGWLNATIELTGTVHEGAQWTLRVDGRNYSYVPQKDDQLSDVALGLESLLPAIYEPVVDGERITIARADNTQFKIASTVLPATEIRPQLVFTEDNWDTPQAVLVWAADDDLIDGGDAKVVAAVEGRVNAIRGPLAINGGILEGVDRSLNTPYMLPGEINDPLRDGQLEGAGTDAGGNAFLTDMQSVHVDPSRGLVEGSFDPRMNDNYYAFTILDGPAKDAFLRVDSVSGDTVTFVGDWPDGIQPLPGNSYYYAPINPNVLVDEADQVDTLFVDNTDSPAVETGTLTETRLSGLGMGPDTLIGDRTLQGGINYLNLELLDIGLGYGQDVFTIESTHSGRTALRSGAKDDSIEIRTLNGHTLVDTGTGNDTIHVGSSGRLANELGGLLTIVGGDDDDVVTVDDSADSDDNVGTLTKTTLTGLGMPGVNEVQVLTIQAAGGDYRLSHLGADGTMRSVTLGYDLTALQLQTILNRDLFNSTGVIVQKDRQSSDFVTYTVTFGGDLAGRNMNPLEWAETLETTGLVPAEDASVNVDVVTRRDGTVTPVVNHVQTFSVNATGGTFQLEFNLDPESIAEIARGLDKVDPRSVPTISASLESVSTVPLAFDISAEDLSLALDPILNPNNSDGGLPHTKNFSVTAIGNVYLITFDGSHRGSRVSGVNTANLVDGADAGTIDVATRLSGINYYGVDTLESPPRIWK